MSDELKISDVTLSEVKSPRTAKHYSEPRFTGLKDLQDFEIAQNFHQH